MQENVAISGHASYSYSLRSGCPIEEAEGKIKSLLPKAKQMDPKFAKDRYYKKNRKRKYLECGEFIFVLNEGGTAVVTVLVKDKIAETLYTHR
jgi:hypothetical protein